MSNLCKVVGYFFTAHNKTKKIIVLTNVHERDVSKMADCLERIGQHMRTYVLLRVNVTTPLGITQFQRMVRFDRSNT